MTRAFVYASVLVALALPARVAAQPSIKLDSRTTSGTIVANGGSVELLNTGGLGTLRTQATGSYTGTWVIQCSSAPAGATPVYDATNTLNLFLEGSTTRATSVTSITGNWISNISGCTAVKAIATSAWTGTLTLYLSTTSTGGSSGASGGGASGGTTTDPDDASIATGQTNDNVNSLNMAYDSSVWRRITFGTAGTASAQVWTVQGVASMTPLQVTNTTVASAGTYLTVRFSDGSSFVTPASDATHGSAVTATGPQPMLEATTGLASDTAVADGQDTRSKGDINGRQIDIQGCNRESRLRGYLSNTDGASTSVISAGGANTFIEVWGIYFANSSASAVTVDVRDGTAGSVLATFSVPAGSPGGGVLPIPITLSANTALAIDGSAAATTLYTTAVGCLVK